MVAWWVAVNHQTNVDKAADALRQLLLASVNLSMKGSGCLGMTRLKCCLTAVGLISGPAPFSRPLNNVYQWATCSWMDSKLILRVYSTGNCALARLGLERCTRRRCTTRALPSTASSLRCVFPPLLTFQCGVVPFLWFACLVSSLLAAKYAANSQRVPAAVPTVSHQSPASMQ